MSLILLEKQGEVWRSRVEGHFILGVHPIETLRKGLPEAMAQAVVDHCAMSGEDVRAFGHRLMAEIDALSPAKAEWTAEAVAAEMGISPAAVTVEPRRARVPRKAAAVAPEAEQAPAEPVASPMPVVEPPASLRAAWTDRSK